jgi:hypothetical protein
MSCTPTTITDTPKVTSTVTTFYTQKFLTFVSLIILTHLRKTVDAVDKKKRKYGSEHDILRKVETYAKIRFKGKYKDVYSTPTTSQRLIFDIFQIPYTVKGEDGTKSKKK